MIKKLENFTLPPLPVEEKVCFTCKVSKKLGLFNIDRRKYQLPSDKGRCKVCISCERDRALKEMSVIRFDFDLNDFKITRFKSKEEVDAFFGIHKAYVEDPKNPIQIGCSYKCTWQNGNFKFELLDIVGNRGKLKSINGKEFWTNVADLIFVKSTENKDTLRRLRTGEFD